MIPGINHLCGPVSKLPRGLTYLNLTKTGMTAKGVNRLAEALSTNKHMPTSLTYLMLGENSFKGEDVTNLYNFLAQPNAIIHLDLSSSEVALELVIGALLKGCCQNLITLNLAHNCFSYKRSKDVQVPVSWKQFFASAISLKYLNLSDCKLPPEALKPLLLGIGVNRNLLEVHLDLSCNDFRSPGATMIESCIADIPNITSFDISDNNFDQDMERICRWIQRNRSIKHLAIGKNFNSVKPKYMHHVLDSVVQVIQEEESPIESLSLADSKLKSDTAIIINALGSNSTLKTLDISGNQMGDFGARMLAKALQINTKLRSIAWDKNNTTVQGFEDIAAALQKNYTVRKMPAPFHDTATALKVMPDRTEKALQTIERLLQRNHSPRKFASEQAFRLQQGFLISSTQQMVDKLVVHLQDTINALNMSSSDEFKVDIENGQRYISDADNSKQLLPKLQEIALSQEAEGNPVQAKLHSITQDLKDLVEEQMKGTVNEMLGCVKEQCPGVLDIEPVQKELEEGSAERSQFPKDFTKILIMDQVGTDVLNKISELNLSVAAYISDRMVDQVIEALGTTQKTLTNHLNTRKSLKRALPEKVQQEEKQDGESSEKEQFTIDKDEKEKPSPGDSPKVKSKRQSMYMRKMRPQSVVEIKVDSPEKDALDGPMSKSTPEPIQEDSKERGEDADIVGDLPSLPGQKLEHLNKARPKRAKTRAATRPMKVPSVIDMVEEDLGGDTVDNFFEKKPVSKEQRAVHPDEPAKSKPAIDKNEETRESGSKKKGWSRFGHKDKEKDKDKEKEKKEKGGFAAGFKAGLSSLWSKGSSGTKSPETHRKSEKSHSDHSVAESPKQPSLKSSTTPEHAKSRSPSRRAEDLKKSDSLEKLSKRDSLEHGGTTKTSSLERSLGHSSPKSGSLERNLDAGSVVDKSNEKSLEKDRAGSIEKSLKTSSLERGQGHVPLVVSEPPETGPKATPKVEEEHAEDKEDQDKKTEEKKPEEEVEQTEAPAPAKKPMVPKFGMGFGGGILSEMKAKRESKMAKPALPDDKPKEPAKESPQPVPAPRTRSSAARASRLAEKMVEQATEDAKATTTTITTTAAADTATISPSISASSEEVAPSVKEPAVTSPPKVSSASTPTKTESSPLKPQPPKPAATVKTEKESTADGPSPKQPMKPKPLVRPKPPPVAPKPKPKPRPKTATTATTPEGSSVPGKDGADNKDDESSSRPTSMIEEHEDRADGTEESLGTEQTPGGSSSTEDLTDKMGHSLEKPTPTAEAMARSRSLHGQLSSTTATERQQKTRSLFSAISKEVETQFQKKEEDQSAVSKRDSAGMKEAVEKDESLNDIPPEGSAEQEKPADATNSDKTSAGPEGSVVQQQKLDSEAKDEKSDKSEDHSTPPPFEGKTSEGGASTDEFEFVDEDLEEDVVMV